MLRDVSAAEIKAACERAPHGYQPTLFFQPPPGMNGLVPAEGEAMHRGITLSPTDAAYITGFADRTATNPTVGRIRAPDA